MTTLRNVVVALMLVALLGALGLVCARTAERGRFAAPFSTYGAGPEGTRGAFLLVSELGKRPVRWAEDFGDLPARTTLLAIGGCDAAGAREMVGGERRELDRWVRAGGTLIVAGANDYLTGDELGVKLPRKWVQCTDVTRTFGTLTNQGDGGVPPLGVLGTPGLFDGEDSQHVTHALAQPGPLAPLGSLAMRDPAPIELSDPTHSEILLRDEDDSSLVRGVALRRGAGWVVALASGSPFQNRDLRASDGGPLLARLLDTYGARGGAVLFDEYHLGVGDSRSTMRYLADEGLGPLALQIALILAIVLWRAGARFGPPRRAAVAPPAGTASYVAGIAGLYAKSKDPSAALGVLARGACARIAAHHHVQGQEETQLAAQLEQRGRKEAAAAVKRIGEIRASAPRDAKSLVALSREIDVAVAKATVK